MKSRVANSFNNFMHLVAIKDINVLLCTLGLFFILLLLRKIFSFFHIAEQSIKKEKNIVRSKEKILEMLRNINPPILQSMQHNLITDEEES